MYINHDFDIILESKALALLTSFELQKTRQFQKIGRAY